MSRPKTGRPVGRPKTLPEEIIEKIKASDLPQRKLAKELGISECTVWRVRNAGTPDHRARRKENPNAKTD